MMNMVGPGSFPYDAHSFPESSKQQSLVLASTRPAPASQHVPDSPKGLGEPSPGSPITQDAALAAGSL